MNKYLALVLEYARESSDARVREAALRLAPRRRTPAERASEQAKQKKRQGREEETARLRAQVMRRANGKCELCGHDERGWDGLVLHHVVGGSGKRKAEESYENVVAIHDRSCHKAIHADPTFMEGRVWAWCERHGFMETWRKFQIRIAKVAEARAARTEKESARNG